MEIDIKAETEKVQLELNKLTQSLQQLEQARQQTINAAIKKQGELELLQRLSNYEEKEVNNG